MQRLDDRSRMSGDVHVRFCERLEGRFLRATRLIITANTQEDILNIMPHVETWLSQRGLRLNSEKTQVVSIHDGFDFLGFNIRQFKGKWLVS
jgi:Reverse transcriptase (RNA-dependent DNA polymerase)